MISVNTKNEPKKDIEPCKHLYSLPELGMFGGHGVLFYTFPFGIQVMGYPLL